MMWQSGFSIHNAKWSVMYVTDMIRQSLEEAWHVCIVSAHRGISESE